jgi:hypothetical protein
MISIEIDAKQLKALQKAVERSGKKFAKELAGAINAVSKKTKLQIGRDIRATVAIPKAEAEKPLSIRGTATEQNLSATVTLKKTKRLGLRHFGARQDKRGVSYKIDKQGGRKRVQGAFQGPRPGVQKMSWKGNAFKRVGASRLPIVMLKGVSAYGAYAKNELSGPQVEAINAELTKQMERRIKLNILRAEGLVAK